MELSRRSYIEEVRRPETEELKQIFETWIDDILGVIPGKIVSTTKKRFAINDPDDSSVNHMVIEAQLDPDNPTQITGRTIELYNENVLVGRYHIDKGTYTAGTIEPGYQITRFDEWYTFGFMSPEPDVRPQAIDVDVAASDLQPVA